MTTFRESSNAVILWLILVDWCNSCPQQAGYEYYPWRFKSLPAQYLHGMGNGSHHQGQQLQPDETERVMLHGISPCVTKPPRLGGSGVGAVIRFGALSKQLSTRPNGLRTGSTSARTILTRWRTRARLTVPDRGTRQRQSRLDTVCICAVGLSP